MIRTLRALGVRVHDRNDHLPLHIQGPIRGGEVQVEGLVSSQFITGLLLALPIAEEETTIHVPHVISTPYIDITIDTAERFGIEILHKDYKEFYVAGGQRYRPAEFEIESDLVLLAMGFLHPSSPVMDAFGVQTDMRGNAQAAYEGKDAFRTNVPKVFAAGDCRRGQSLVVRALAEGRRCAEAVDKFLSDEQN